MKTKTTRRRRPFQQWLREEKWTCIVLLAAAVFCAVFHTAVGDSLLGLVNRYLAQRQSREAMVYVPYACNEVSAMWAGIPISVAVGTALGMLAARAPRWGLGVYGVLLCLALWSGVGGEWLLPALCGSAVLLPAGEGDKRALRARRGGAAAGKGGKTAEKAFFLPPAPL